VPPPDPSYGVLVPVKPVLVAKSRLGGLGHEVRRQLAAAFAADTVRAALDCAAVATVMVVTDDHVLAGRLRLEGAAVIPDGVAEDLNESLVQAAAELLRRGPGLRLAALCADLPALRPTDLETVLRAAPVDVMGFVADADGVGTTVVTAPGLSAFRPAFGRGSRAQHLAAGALEIEPGDVASVRRDVDTPHDLAEAFRLGVGPRTAQVASDLF
jgi:2-phospho-L-lactate/phosphoenolpyruvate guanylyltransferase